MLPPIWLALHGHLLWFAALAIVLAGGWSLERALRSWRSRRAWRARAGSVPRSSGETGSDVRMSGTLRIEGNAAKRFEDGAPVAIASAAAGPRAEQDAACVSVRADRVWLDTKDGPIELRGPVQVVGGRTIRTAGAPTGLAWSRLSAALGDESDWPFTSLAVELRSVAAGDRVEVAGKLERAIDGDASDYRSTMRRVLVPSEGTILVQLDAPAPARSWRGPLLGLVLFAIANAVLVPIPRSWDYDVAALSLISPITRPRALDVLEQRIRTDADEALRYGSPIARDTVALASALSPQLACEERAHLLRAGGDLEAALDETARCPGMVAMRERSLTLFALGREEDARASWAALLRAADERCVEGPCGDTIAIATSPSPLDWGGYYPSEVPRALFLGRWSPARPHIAHRLVELLEGMTLRSTAMRRTRIEWALELAALELELERVDRATELLDAVRAQLDATDLPESLTGPLRRDADHLMVLLFLRGGDLELARQMTHPNDGTVPCPMIGVVAAARDPYRNGPEVLVGATFRYEDVRELFRDPTLSRAPSWLDDRESLAWVEHFGRVSDPTRVQPITALLGNPRSCTDPSLVMAAWDAASARASEALGASDRGGAFRACVLSARAALYARPPLERYE